MLQSRFRRIGSRSLVNSNGQNRKKTMCNKTKKKLRNQLPKPDYKEALLTDMKSKLESS